MQIPENLSEPVRPKQSSVRWLIAGMVGAFAFVSYIERMNISVAAELMMPDLGLTKIQMGQVFSSFLVGYAIFQVPAGQLGDVIGPTATLALAALFWGCATILTAVVANIFVAGSASLLMALVAVRFLLGASEGATFPVGSRAIRNWTPPRERAFGNAFMMAGSASAAAVSAPLVSWLMVRFGWRPAFYITSVLAFGIALLWYRMATDYPRDHRRVSPRELEVIGNLPGEPVPKHSSLSELLTDRNICFFRLAIPAKGTFSSFSYSGSISTWWKCGDSACSMEAWWRACHG